MTVGLETPFDPLVVYGREKANISPIGFPIILFRALAWLVVPLY